MAPKKSEKGGEKEKRGGGYGKGRKGKPGRDLAKNFDRAKHSLDSSIIHSANRVKRGGGPLGPAYARAANEDERKLVLEQDAARIRKRKETRPYKGTQKDTQEKSDEGWADPEHDHEFDTTDSDEDYFEPPPWFEEKKPKPPPSSGSNGATAGLAAAA